MMFSKHLTKATSRRLWDIFSKAELEYQFKCTPIAETLRREANKQLGQTRKILLQVAALGPTANEWMGYFIQRMEELDDE